MGIKRHHLLQVAYFVNSGSEANDMAIMMARIYSGNYDLIALRNAYHGLSESTMGLLGQSTWKFNIPQVGTWFASCKKIVVWHLYVFELPSLGVSLHPPCSCMPGMPRSMLLWHRLATCMLNLQGSAWQVVWCVEHQLDET